MNKLLNQIPLAILCTALALWVLFGVFHFARLDELAEQVPADDCTRLQLTKEECEQRLGGEIVASDLYGELE